ncbi:deoxyribodipyrimidine photo-lyase, partial [Aquimarina celericrescens]|nr:deoxyribodipyrimidine photo-lyase [Aquimarina celericrescens]
FKKTEKYRAKFLIESVTQLSTNLKNLNITLQVEHDERANVLKQLAEKYSIKTVFFQTEWTKEEKQVELEVKSVLTETNFIDNYN